MVTNIVSLTLNSQLQLVQSMVKEELSLYQHGIHVVRLQLISLLSLIKPLYCDIH